MTNDIPTSQKRINFFTTFTLTCIGFTVLAILTLFFVEDLLRIFTPFFLPFLLLFILLAYLILVVVSLFYLARRRITWQIFIPLFINAITFLIVYYLYIPLRNLRMDTGFQVEENRFNQVAQWVNQSIQDGDLRLEMDREETVVLPNAYQNLADRGRIYVTQTYNGISIFFSRGGGMFEYEPGFMYHSENVSPPIEDGDIVCVRQIRPNWYDCH